MTEDFDTTVRRPYGWPEHEDSTRKIARAMPVPAITQSLPVKAKSEEVVTLAEQVKHLRLVMQLDELATLRVEYGIVLCVTMMFGLIMASAGFYRLATGIAGMLAVLAGTLVAVFSLLRLRQLQMRGRRYGDGDTSAGTGG